MSRNWVSLCDFSHPPLIALIREFYSNLSVNSEDASDHYLTTWIKGKEFKITKCIVSEALGVPLLRRPIYPFTESPPIDDVMSLLYGRSVTWGSEPRKNSSEFTEFNYLFFGIVCHNIFPVSHIHTIPLDRYAFIADGSMCFPSPFIQTIVEVFRSKSKAHKLFFPVFIYKVLTFLGLEDFPTLELVHITAPIGVTFLRQRQARMKSVKPSTRTSKRPRVEASTAAPAFGDQPAAIDPAKEIHVDPIAIVDPAGDAKTIDPIFTPPLSLYAMMETFMTTKAAHE